MVVNDIAILRDKDMQEWMMGGSRVQQSVFVYHFDILSVHLEYTTEKRDGRGARLRLRRSFRLVALGCRPILVRPEVHLAAEGTWRPAWA